MDGNCTLELYFSVQMCILSFFLSESVKGQGPLILALRGQRQAYICELGASLACIAGRKFQARQAGLHSETVSLRQ